MIYSLYFISCNLFGGKFYLKKRKEKRFDVVFMKQMVFWKKKINKIFRNKPNRSISHILTNFIRFQIESNIEIITFSDIQIAKH